MTTIQIEVAQWFQNLCATSNKKFIPLFFDEHRFLVLKGGGGSGKSVFAARKLIERAYAEPGHRFLVCRKVAKTLRESCWENILKQLAEYYPGRYKANVSNMTITCDTGTKFIFAGLDDVEKLKSIVGITGIWIEEASEIKEEDLAGHQADDPHRRPAGHQDHHERRCRGRGPGSDRFQRLRRRRRPRAGAVCVIREEEMKHG